MSDPKLADEPARISALNRFCVLDTCNEAQFDKITSLVRSVLDVPIAAVSLVDVDRQWFKSMDGIDVSETPRDISFCTHTIRTRAPLNVADAHLDPRFMNSPLVTEEPHIRSYLGAPLRTPDGYNVGALCAIDRRPRDFGPVEELLLSKFAALVIDELELRLKADSDFLTKVHTRRALLDRVQAELVQQPENPGALIVFDIDHFKSVNDGYGHPAGDEVLKAVAAACHSVLRRDDAIGRMGGEEFAVLLPGMGIAQAIACAERMRAAIAKLPFAYDPQRQITASFGVAMLTSHVDATFAEADAALYMAKRQGRNRVITAETITALAA